MMISIFSMLSDQKLIVDTSPCQLARGPIKLLFWPLDGPTKLPLLLVTASIKLPFPLHGDSVMFTVQSTSDPMSSQTKTTVNILPT
jgi:hypothetical protein